MPSKRKQESLEEVLARPWCYYCDRDFDDLKILIDHQRAKHYQCFIGQCHRRLNTIGGLKVHMDQVHKEKLLEVPNALEGRKEINLEIFGMHGIPQDVMDQYTATVTRQYHQMEAEHMRKTGNPLPGSGQSHQTAKKPKVESKEDLKRRVAEAKAKRAAEKAAGAAVSNNGTPLPSGTAPPSTHMSNTPPQMTPAYGAPVATGPTPTPPNWPSAAFTPPPGFSMSSSPPAVAFSAPPPGLPPHPGFGNFPPPYAISMLPGGAPPVMRPGSNQPAETFAGPGRPPVNSIPTPPYHGLNHPSQPKTVHNDAFQDDLEALLDTEQQKYFPSNTPSEQARRESTVAVPQQEPSAPASTQKSSDTMKGFLLKSTDLSWEEKRARNPRYQPKSKPSTTTTQDYLQAVTGTVDEALQE